jgi:hypothetical protein
VTTLKSEEPDMAVAARHGHTLRRPSRRVVTGSTKTLHPVPRGGRRLAGAVLGGREPTLVRDTQRLQQCLRPLQASKSALAVVVLWLGSGRVHVASPVRGGTPRPRLNPEEGDPSTVTGSHHLTRPARGSARSGAEPGP